MKFFQRGKPKILVKIGNFLFAFGQNGPEKMFNDHLVGKQAPPRPRFVILKSCHSEIFLKGLTHDFCQKLQISSLFVFGEKFGL